MLSPAVSLTILDSGTGVDAAAVSVTVTVTDSGSPAVEALSVVATMLVTSWTAAPAVTAQRERSPIVIADSGTGVDTPGGSPWRLRSPMRAAAVRRC